MDLYIKQHIFTWGDKFSVYDEFQNEIYIVEGEIFTWGKKLHIYDASGNEVAFIEQEVFSFLPKYYIFKGDEQVGEVVKEFTFFVPQYSVNGLGFEVSGDFFEHNYEIYKNEQTIATVSKEWLTWGDTYQISIEQGQDEVAILAVVIVIDACIQASRNNN